MRVVACAAMVCALLLHTVAALKEMTAKDLLTTEGKFLMKSMSRLTPEGDEAAWARDFIAEPKYARYLQYVGT
jgi:hypothetical protein